MEFVIEYTSIHDDGDYIYPDMSDVTIHAPDRDSAIREFHEMYPSGSFVKYHVDAIHLIPHEESTLKYSIELNDNGQYLIKPVDSELIAIAVSKADAQLVCDALNAYHSQDQIIDNDSQQLDLFDN